MAHNASNNLYNFFLDTPSLQGLEELPWPQQVPMWGLAPHVQLSHYDNDNNVYYPGEMFDPNVDVQEYPSFCQSGTREEYWQHYPSAPQPNPHRQPPPAPPLTPTSGFHHPPAIVFDDACFIQPGHGWGSPPTLPRAPQLQSAGTNTLRSTREAETDYNLRSNPTDGRENPSSGSTAVERESASQDAHQGRNNIKRGPLQKTTKRGRQGHRYDLEKDPRLSMCTPLKTEEVKVEADEGESQESKTSSSKRKMGDDDSETSPPPPPKRQRDQTTLEGHIIGPSNDNPSSSSQLELYPFIMDSLHGQENRQGSERTSL